MDLTTPTDTLEHPLILSSRVLKEPVFNLAGTKIGHVNDLSVEKASGRVIYAIMSFGGFLGIGEKFHPVPWAVLQYDIERDGFVVPLDETVLKDAPSYSADELRALGGVDYREALLGYYSRYGMGPYW
ncbi:MAG: PRC-barrel domain-containing protein [Sphingomonadales bacterium]|nr:PRC-barrel domain-containing protein [Sphingomonadales bacterium]